MKEWEIYQETRDSRITQINWGLKGELELSLFVRKAEGYQTDFEIARSLEDPQLANVLGHELCEYDRQALIRGEHVIDVLPHGKSLEKLEKYLEEHLLPIPENIREIWEG